MSQIDERIERLICRLLDGELTDEEQLELNREVIRNPEAHRLLDEYRQIDGLATIALETALDRPSSVQVSQASRGEQGGVALGQATQNSRVGSLEVRPAVVGSFAGRKQLRIWWLVPGAVAAALLAVAIARLTPMSSTMVTQNGDQPKVHRLSSGEVPTMTVGFPTDNQPRINRKTNRNGYGVIGEDGKLYWIEVDHTRTLTRPSPQTAAQLDWGGM